MNLTPPGNVQKTKQIELYLAVIVSALGYFVDIYDLALFGIVRVESLMELGYSGLALQEHGIYILNMQMLGMLLGGVLWGVLGDKMGRTSVLFGSIFLYSLANICNGFVQDVNTYAWIRFFAGIGLAGELGIGITLVTESLPQKYRGYGTLLIATSGALGAVMGYYVADLTNWRIAYFIGGGMGLILLLMRFRLLDSPLYLKMRATAHSSGDFFIIFTRKELLSRYLKCILIGLPLWSTLGIIATFSPEIALSMNISGPVSSGKCIMICNAGIALGDVGSGLLSQLLKSRKVPLTCFILFSLLVCFVLLFKGNYSAYHYYLGIFLLGIGTGMWALTITMTSEQFGTDIRATVTTSVPNFVRGMIIPLTICFQALQDYFPIHYSALIISGSSLLLALMALSGLKETFNRNMDFYETKKVSP